MGEDITPEDVKKYARRTFSGESQKSTVSVDNKTLSISVHDKKMLKAIEQLLKDNGFGIEYV